MIDTGRWCAIGGLGDNNTVIWHWSWQFRLDKHNTETRKCTQNDEKCIGDCTSYYDWTALKNKSRCSIDGEEIKGHNWRQCDVECVYPFIFEDTTYHACTYD